MDDEFEFNEAKDDEAVVMDLFRTIDTDGSGIITRDEMIGYLARVRTV